MHSLQRYGFIKAAGKAVVRTGQMSWLTLDMVWKMVTGQASWRNLSGPINIAQYAGYTARIGLVPFLAFLAIVSISLGILNLLPIPVLDGGHLMYYLIEAVRGKPVSLRAELIGAQIGIFLLMLLMGFAVFNDLSRIISG
jgi:regulator of sigma E protease